MARYQIETTTPDGKPIIVPIPDEFLDQLIAQHSASVREDNPVECPCCGREAHYCG